MEMILRELRKVFPWWRKPNPWGDLDMKPWSQPGRWSLFRERTSDYLSGPLETFSVFAWSEDTLDSPPQLWPALPQELTPPVRLEACDHGVLCLADSKSGHIYLWNPSLGHLKKLPAVPGFPVAAFRLGLGHVAATGDMKVVMISVYDCRPAHYTAADEGEMFTGSSRFSVYSLKADMWTTVDALFPALFAPPEELTWTFRNEGPVHDRRHCAVVAQGALHWGLRFAVESSLAFAVVAFDLSTEAFRLITTRKVLPITGQYVGRAFRRLAVGSLDKTFKRALLNVMLDYGDDDSWITCADVDMPELTGLCDAVLCGVAADNYLLLTGRETGRLFWYDLTNASLRFTFEDWRIGAFILEYSPSSYALY